MPWEEILLPYTASYWKQLVLGQRVYWERRIITIASLIIIIIYFITFLINVEQTINEEVKVRYKEYS
jgi:hypothetical protein